MPRPPPARSARYHVTVGAAAESICQTADTLGADLIVTGTRGLTGLNRLVMGTTAEHVIRGASRPVLTVPGHRRRTRAHTGR